MLLGYISFYARYAFWAGDFAWGDRYVSTSVEMVAMMAVPLLLRHRENLSRTIWISGIALITVSLIIQLASLAFWLPLEIYQMETLGHPTFVIALRFKNIAAFALGKMDAWGLNNESMTQDAWITFTSPPGIFCRFCCAEWVRRRSGWWIQRLPFGERRSQRWRVFAVRYGFCMVEW